MKQTYRCLLASMFSLVPVLARSQSTMEFQSGTHIEVTTGADICADNVAIDGTYSGSGTQCLGPLPVEFVSMTCVAGKSFASIKWTTATEANNFGFEIERRPIGVSEWMNVGFVRGSGTATSPNEYSFTDERVSPGRHAYRIKQIDHNGAFSYTSSLEVEIGLAPLEFTLSQNYPNPFNPTTTIEFTLAQDGRVTLKIYDVSGREVATLLDDERNAGIYQHVVWDARGMPSGTYFARLEFSGRVLVQKIALLK